MFDTELESDSLTAEEIAQLKENIDFFCNTPKGSLPQMREYGIDFDIFDKPFNVTKTRATVDIIKGLRKYYSIGIEGGKLQIESIKITANTNGGMKLKIRIGGNNT